MTALDHHAAQATPWHLRGNWAPVHDELTVTDLAVTGAVPPELEGVYVRTGPNPKSGRSDHWFFGDGMVHGVRLGGGRAQWYRNRFVQTPNVTEADGDVMANMGRLERGTGNTHVLRHQDRILCLEEGHWPWQIDAELNTIGCVNWDGALTTSMTAHPKVCPVTGELLAFSYLSPRPPFLHYIRIGADGALAQLEPIEIPNMVMMHDFNVTRNHVVFMDLPVCFDLDALATGMPFKFRRDAGARLGVMPRNGTNADVRWFEIEPCYVFHPVNAFEDGDLITLFVSRQPEAFGSSNDDYAEVGRLWKWTIDLVAGTVHEEQVDDRPGDFGRVDDRLVGLDARYGYLMAMAGEGVVEEPVYGSSLLKYDLRSGQCWEHRLGDGVRGAEPVFAPRSPDAAEDDGWVISFAHDTVTGESTLRIVDTRDFSGAPVAVVHLPRRVPYGAHGSWLPDA
ncbi:MAG: carotenoid oxygenase family protein [Acidimicrobiales bacterium]|nr:carotenoid oxygenase family protein [Acidimicrobiales bacterium]MCB9393433.1 carotenoid oxygenase family protein [Acidimicrobiaceae bacterium]